MSLCGMDIACRRFRQSRLETRNFVTCCQFRPHDMTFWLHLPTYRTSRGQRYLIENYTRNQRSTFDKVCSGLWRLEVGHVSVCFQWWDRYCGWTKTALGKQRHYGSSCQLYYKYVSKDCNYMSTGFTFMDKKNLKLRFENNPSLGFKISTWCHLPQAINPLVPTIMYP